jgi:cytochrome P450
MLLFIEEGLIITCFDLFAAGAESVSNTLSFSLLYTVLHPEVQRMVQHLLDYVVGRDRRPCLDDRPRYA